MSDRVDCESCVCDPDRPGCVPEVPGPHVTVVEWGVRWVGEGDEPDERWGVEEDRARERARRWAADGARAVSRTVTYGPWVES